LDYINGYLKAYPKSWAYANAASIASTYATAFTAVANSSFASVCVVEHGNICGGSRYKGNGICEQTADVACTAAYSVGSGFAVAVSQAVAAAYVHAEATAEANVYISANLDCKATPILTWKHANAGHDNICHQDNTCDAVAKWLERRVRDTAKPQSNKKSPTLPSHEEDSKPIQI
jgi:hypothetical protein